MHRVRCARSDSEAALCAGTMNPRMFPITSSQRPRDRLAARKAVQGAAAEKADKQEQARSATLLAVFQDAGKTAAGGYEDLAKAFSSLDTKAQIVTTVSGVAFGGLIALFNAGKVSTALKGDPAATALFALSTVLSIAAIVAAFAVMWLRNLPEPFPSVEQIQEARDLRNLGPDELSSEHQLDFHARRLADWQRVLEATSSVVARKAQLAKWAQGLLLATFGATLFLMMAVALQELRPSVAVPGALLAGSLLLLVGAVFLLYKQRLLMGALLGIAGLVANLPPRATISASGRVDVQPRVEMKFAPEVKVQGTPHDGLVAVAKFNGFASGSDQLDCHGSKIDGELAKLTTALVEANVRKQRLVMLLVGSTDRTRLNSELRRRYESNSGLARARVSAVVKCLQDRRQNWDESAVTLIPSITGPSHTPAKGIRSIDPDEVLMDDRGVTVLAFTAPNR